MKIIAVDPGFAATGVAIMESFDGALAPGWAVLDLICIRTKPPTNKRGLRVADQDAARVAEMSRKLIDIIRVHQPDGAVVELPHGGGQSAKAVRCMGLATGMIVAIIEGGNLAVEWYPPNETRKAATGSTQASKDQVMDAMAKVYPALAKIPTKAEREHIGDALSTFQAALMAGNLVRLA